MQWIRRDPVAMTDENGTPCYRVPLARGQGHALVEAADYERMVKDGLSEHWHLNANGAGFGYIKGQHRNRGRVSIAREVLGLKRDDQYLARYRNGNTCDLRRANLYEYPRESIRLRASEPEPK